jgi:hypothetical protein
MSKDPDKTTEEGFISRWSRRKTEIAVTADFDDIDTLSDSQLSGELVAIIDPDEETSNDLQSEEVVLTDEDMPPIESLNKDSDFSMFMSSGVSDALRQIALRKLFSGFNIRDGLDDYDDDFRNFEALGDLVTCDMKHQIEMAEERKRKEEEAKAAEEALTETEGTEKSRIEEDEGENLGPENETPEHTTATNVDGENTDGEYESQAENSTGVNHDDNPDSNA